jgi:hypothetical protein
MTKAMRKSKSDTKELSQEQSEELLATLKIRFEKNMTRHKGLKWADVEVKLEGDS